MRFFRHNKQGPGRRPLMGNETLSTASSALESSHAVHTESDRRPVYEVGWNAPKRENENSKSKGITSLVNRMKCGKKLHDSDLHLTNTVGTRSNREAPPTGGWRVRFQQPAAAESQTTARPVLITINEGEEIHDPRGAGLSAQERRPTSEIKTTRITVIDPQGPQPTSKYSRYKELRQTQRQSRSRNSNNDKHLAPSTPPVSSSRYGNRGHSVYRHGPQHTWTREDNIPSLMNCEDESSIDDEASQSVFTGFETVTSDASVTTGYTGVYTEYSGAETEFTGMATEYTEYTDYTYGTGYLTDVTEASDESSEGQSSAEPDYRNQRSRRSRSSRRERRERNNDTSLLAGVAEDLSTVASFVIVDGASCLRCAADISSETVAGWGVGEHR